ncbi:MAG: FAD-binding protein [Streptosporangiales bacterium]|nr:FAD-binding protein [Streptosporangiales bacterium]
MAATGARLRPGTADDAVGGIVPAQVASPDSVEQAAALLAAAHALGLRTVFRGAGTKLAWGSPPQACDLLLETVAMDRVLDHAAGDLVVQVQAGVPMARLSGTLGGADQELAVESPVPGGTVGGMLGSGVAGPRRMLHGTARDLLIGVTMVLADGTVARSGGRVVKNVAGYDLGKLLTGSYGTLGLIAEATFRLHPKPAATAYVTATARDPGHAAELLQAVFGSQTAPSAIELDLPPGGEPELAVLLEGTPRGVQRRAGDVGKLLGTDAQDIEAPLWWNRLPGGDTLLELRSWPKTLGRVLTAVSELAASAEVKAVLRGSAGVGHFRIGVSGEPAAQAHFVGELRSALGALDGGVTVTDAPDAVRGLVDVWGPVPGLELMRRVKDRFDPGWLLAPGRFFGRQGDGLGQQGDGSGRESVGGDG